MNLFAEIADGVASESPLWLRALRPRDEWEPTPVFSRLLPEARFELGFETIYEGYLVHFGRSRLFAPSDDDLSLLLGDALLALGLVRIAGTGAIAAVDDVATLLSLCAQVRADEREGDGAAWAATAAALARGGLDDARYALRFAHDPGPLEQLARETAGDAAVETALAAHERFAVV